MTVTTSKGKTFDIESMWGPTIIGGQLAIRLRDARALSKIAKDFEGCDGFQRESELEGNMDFEGYTQLVSISRTQGAASDVVQIVLEKPK